MGIRGYKYKAMRLDKITEDNAKDLNTFLDDDLIHDISRIFYGGLGVFDDDGNPYGALVYELLNVTMGNRSITSVIHCFRAKNKEAFEMLFTGYESLVQKIGIERSIFETESKEQVELFQRYNFVFKKKVSSQFRISLKDIDNINLNLEKEVPDNIRDISDVSILMYRNAIMSAISNGYSGAVSDLAYLPLNWYEKEISSCSLEDGKISGLLLVRKQPSGVLYFVLYTAFGTNKQLNLAYMLIRTINMIISNYPPETEILINCLSDRVKSLIKQLLPDYEEREVNVGIRDESIKDKEKG